MAFLAIRKTAYAALPAHVKKVVRFAFAKLDLIAEGQTPPTMLSPTNVEHYVFCSPLFTVEDAAILALIATNIDKVPDPEDGVDKAEIRRRLRNALTWAVPEIPSGQDPFTYTLTFNSAPAAIKMYNDVPAGWREA
jgi:hypothetical protein